MRRHFTAWLVNDPSALDQPCMDVTVLEDQLLTGDPDDERAWSTDTTKPRWFFDVTDVPADGGDVDEAQAQAEDLLSGAGWRLAGKWEAVPNAFVVTVERDET